MVTIGNKIKVLREKAGLSQTHIAQFLGIDQSTVSKCEKGERQFQVDHLERLGNLFGVSLGDLMNEDLPVAHLQIAFRADGLLVEDLNAIADIQKIAMNLDRMLAILRENLHEA